MSSPTRLKLLWLSIASLSLFACCLLFVFIGAVVFVVQAVLDSPSATPDVTVPAPQLWSDYTSDIVAADRKYLNKTVELSGVSGKVEKDKGGRYFIGALPGRLVKDGASRPRGGMTVEDAQRQMFQDAVNSRNAPCVILYISDRDAGQFSGIEGRTITIRGRCKGLRTESSATPEHEVVVENCVLVK